MGCGTINFPVPATALLVMEPTSVSDTGQHQTMPDAADLVAVSCEPSDRPYGSRGEKKTVGISEVTFCQKLRQICSDHQTRKVVIGQRRMTGMGRNQDLFI